MNLHRLGWKVELRILDVDLAKRLGYARPVSIRDLIKRHHSSLLEMGPLRTVRRVINGGEATEYHLNRKQDVAERLGYADPTNAMKPHCKGVVKRHPLLTAGGV